VGSACRPFGVPAVAFIVAMPALNSRLWIRARIPERGILAEQDRLASTGERGREPALHECLGSLNGYAFLRRHRPSSSLLRWSTAGDRHRKISGAGMIEVPCFICSISS